MARMFAVYVEGIDMAELKTLPDDMLSAARKAVNDAARHGVAVGKDLMRKQINFPTGYLDGNSKYGKRFGIASYASNDKLTAVVRGRDDATSLARFVVGGPAAKPKRSGKKQEFGVSVMVDPGKPKEMRSAFMIKLANGNLGLALYDPSGKGPRNTHGARQLSKSVWLLYGPSVSQVFDETRNEMRDDLQDYMAKRFNHHLKVTV